MASLRNNVRRRGISASGGSDPKKGDGKVALWGDTAATGSPSLGRLGQSLDPPKEERQKRLEEAAKKAEEDALKRKQEIEKQRQELRETIEKKKEQERRERNKRRTAERQNLDATTDQGPGDPSSKKNELQNSDLAALDLLKLPDETTKSGFRDKELQQIRQHYLGAKTERKKIKKPSEKFKVTFTFDWDNSEDTSNIDDNPYLQNRPEPQLLFGRGYRAGIDVHEQRRGSTFYDELARRRHRNDDGKSYLSHSGISQRGSAEGDMGREANGLVSKRPRDSIDDNKHWSDKLYEQMTDRDWRIFREDYDIYIRGSRVPPPIRKWSEAQLPGDILAAIKKAGFSTPTPIQMQAIPIGLELRDLIGIAATGSGKTLAFVLPLLTYVSSLPPIDEHTMQDGPYSLVMAPTRELAQQIHQETVKFGSYCKVRAVLIVGGHSVEKQGFELRNGAEVIIGTPGRLKDCLDRSYTVLSQCNYVVLDEADRMIDMGFEEIVNEILDCIPTSNLKDHDEDTALQQELSSKAGYRRYRVTQMFSATMAPAVEKLTKKYLRNPLYVTIGDVGSGKKSIKQRLEFVSEPKKKQKLQDLLAGLEGPIIVFVNMKKVADVVARHISNMDLKAIALHGGKNQDIREGALESFKSGEYDILVATDVVGRGLDVKGVKAVINYDMPKDIQTYTHRIGRTGRAGASGLAISLVTEDDSHLFYDLKQLLVATSNSVPPELEQHPATAVKPTTDSKVATE